MRGWSPGRTRWLAVTLVLCARAGVAQRAPCCESSPQPADPARALEARVVEAAAEASAVSKTSSILDQIQDPRERKAFAALFRKRSPAERRKLAETFLADFPQSAFLAPVYEIAAKACIDLGDSKGAIEHARRSLEILPENPMLLVPLAAVQLEQGLTAEAAESAQAALEWLDRFSSPSAFSEKEWAVHERGLRASSYYVLGKATAAEGLAASDERRRDKLAQAGDYLEQSWLLSNDAGTAYALGLTRMAQARVRDAAVAFSAACQADGGYRRQAEQRLRKAYDIWPYAPRPAFDEFLRDLQKAVSAERSRASDLAARRRTGTPVHYAGSDSCRPCHRAIYEHWAQTGHARMFRPYKFENVCGNFQDQSWEDEKGLVAARMFQNDGRHYFSVRDKAGQWKRYRVDYTIGSKWQQTYATRLENGQIHVFPLQYSMIESRWLSFWRMVDPPDSERTVLANFPEHTPNTAYLVHCAPCHTSQLRQTRPGPIDPDILEIAEGGVNCETCHGPGAAHNAAMRAAAPGSRPPLELAIEYGMVSARDYVDMCGICHLQSAKREHGPNGEWNYREGFEDFFPRFKIRPYAELARRAFYKDGRFRVVSFIVESFLRSKCYQKGAAHCGHCHDPHAADAATNTKAVKFGDDPDRMCLQCHPDYGGAKLEAHTRHKPSSTGSRCVACHMPPIMSTVLFKAGSHEIDEIPNAEMTARFGQRDSPNACLICHADKDIGWLRLEMGKRRKREPVSISAASVPSPGSASPASSASPAERSSSRSGWAKVRARGNSCRTGA
jgi:predicted CXXCH cytochrome family protein